MLFFKIFSRKDAKAQSFFSYFSATLRLCVQFFSRKDAKTYSFFLFLCGSAVLRAFFFRKDAKTQSFFLISLRLCVPFFLAKTRRRKAFFLFLCATAALRAIFFREGAAEFYKTDTNAVYPSGTWPYTILYKQAYFQECLQTPHSLLRYLLRGQGLQASRHI